MTVLTDLSGALLYFTLLLPIWEQRPLVESDLVPGAYPLKVSVDRIEFAGRGFEYADTDLKQRMVQKLGQSQSAVARDLLVDLARTSDHAGIVATILGQVDRLPLDDPKLEEALAAYFRHAEWQVRFWAVDSYGRLANADVKKLLRVAASDSNPRVRGAAVSAVGGKSQGVRFAELEAPRNDTDPHVRQRAWQASLAARDAGMHQQQIVSASGSDEVATRFAVASALGHAPDLLALVLAKGFMADAHPSVRAATAEQLAKVADDQACQMLLGICGDEDFEVRRAALASLAAFPEERVVARLLESLADRHPFVRQEAEEAVVAVHPGFAVDSLVATVLSWSDFHARMHACNILGRLGVVRHGAAVADLLKKEERPANLVACLNALAKLGYAKPDQAIIDSSRHAAAQVRAAAARVMGTIDSDKIDEALSVLVGDRDNDVVSAAIVSMGRLGKEKFSGTLLKILKDTGMTARYSSTHRAEACWSAGRLASLDKSLLDRLLLQATTPVIPTPSGPVYENDTVLVSVSFALAGQGRRDPAAGRAFGQVYALHAREFTSEELMTLPHNAFLPSDEVREYAAQAKAFLEGREAAPGLRPTRDMVFLYRSLERGH